MSKVYVGTSGWAYASWKPDFYPAKLASAKFLTDYASRLNTVEVNYTFRRFPTEKLLNGWANATPAGFKFAVKANQSITHVKRLRGAAEVAAEFVASLQPLEKTNKLGPVLFQLPPFLKCDIPLLKDFLAGLPHNFRAAFEFRHTSWFTEEVFAALHEKNVALCQAENEEIQAPDVQTSDFFYLRLRKEAYIGESLKQCEQTVQNLSERGEVFAYFKHEESPDNALRAEALLAAVAPQI